MKNSDDNVILTLVDADGDVGAALGAAASALDAAGATLGDPRVLKPGTAAELPLGALGASDAESVARRALANARVDLAVHSEHDGERRRKLLVADMESTVIRNEMLDELADFKGCRDHVERVTARAMAGELDFAEAIRERVALLAGLTVGDLETSMERIVVDPGAAALVATMKAHGALTAPVSGGFTFYAERMAQRLGFDVCEANVLEIAAGRLTGAVVPPIRDRDAKLRCLERLAAERGLGTADALAVGDGSNDLAMIRAAGLGVAFHAKKIVAEAARCRVEHTDLRTLLYFQGYREEEIREAC